MSTATPILSANKLLVRRLMEEDLSSDNFRSVADKIIHPDFYDHTNPPGLERGIEGHKGVVTLFRTAFPDMRWQIEDMIEEGDKVVARTLMTGTHGGDFFGMPATGIKVSMSGVHIVRIKDGRIVEHWGSNDDMGMMRQLGAIPG